MLHRFCFCTLLIAAFSARMAQAATAVWTPLTGASNWDTNADPPWDTALFPNAPTDVANLGANDVTGNQTISLNIPITLGELLVGDISDSQTFTINAGTAGTLTFDNSGSTAKLTRVAGGTGTNTISSNITLTDNLEARNDAATANILALSGIIDGPGSLTKIGTGTVTLSGVNTYGGGTIVKEGNLNVTTSGSALGTGLVTLDGGTLLSTVPGATTLPVKNDIHVDTTGTLGSSSGSAQFGGVRDDLTVTKLTGTGILSNYQSSTGAVIINADISGFSGTFDLNNTGSAVGFNLSSVSSPSPATPAQIAASMDGSNAKFILNGSSLRSVRFGSASTGQDNPGLTFRMGELSGDGNIINPNGNAGNVVVEVGALGTDSTWGGTLVNSTSAAATPSTSSLHKVGGGTLTLTGSSTYTGPTAGTLPGGLTAGTTVSGGKLFINGSHSGNGTYEVRTGATLGGIGILGISTVTVNSGGFLAPGESTGTGLFYVGSADIDGTLKIEFGDNAIDFLFVPGALDLTNATIDFRGLGDMSNGAYVFATYGSLVNGNTFANVLNLPGTMTIQHDTFFQTFSLVGEYIHSLTGDYNEDGFVNAADYALWRDNPDGFGGNPGGYNAWRSNFGNPSGAGSGHAAAIPEPATWALLLCAALGVLGYRQRLNA